MKHLTRLLLLFFAVLAAGQADAQNVKREFRGAWIQAVNGQFMGLGTARMQQTLSYQLDELQKMGCNAVIFQVRPECDALYQSAFEPWSRFLTGQQGTPPQPYWDPLQWMIEQCHQRGMELHAWINPYRAKTSGTKQVAMTHVVAQHPAWCFTYGDLVLLNPALQECRDYICLIATDIVTRYDVDGLHLDDYFYPYPVAGQTIPDDVQYQVGGRHFNSIGDWRRHNVNLFIEQLYKTVHKIKPWVKVGISPFGIYRNKANDPDGSNTNGMQNYDDLYADILLWVNKGWLDYCVPQIYWEIGNKSADYTTLIRWWDEYAGKRPLFIGEDVERTVKYADPQNPNSNQQPAKQRLHQLLPHVQGTVLWYAKAAVDNPSNFATALQQVYWRTPALQPQMKFISSKSPSKPRKLKVTWSPDACTLTWQPPSGKKWTNKAVKYVVYRFAKGEKVNLEDPTKIVTVTTNTFLQLPYQFGQVQYQYVVTALNRLHNESSGAKKKVEL